MELIQMDTIFVITKNNRQIDSENLMIQIFREHKTPHRNSKK